MRTRYLYRRCRHRELKRLKSTYINRKNQLPIKATDFFVHLRFPIRLFSNVLRFNGSLYSLYTFPFMHAVISGYILYDILKKHVSLPLEG